MVTYISNHAGHEYNGKVFPVNISFILHGALVGAGSLDGFWVLICKSVSCYLKPEFHPNFYAQVIFTDAGGSAARDDIAKWQVTLMLFSMSVKFSCRQAHYVNSIIGLVT
jgi:hypothetical protein